jgi:ubiquinone/menaquinone biosynthesis C-methylase UbiE
LPIGALWTTAPFFYPGEFLDFVLDGLHIYRRRHTRRHKDLPEGSENFPEYYRRNFHFQTDGYFSTQSAARYDRQVDLLFGGTAEAMRRLWVRPLLEEPGMEEARLAKGESLRILELGCGAGSATVSFLGVFPEADVTGLDLSVPYLEYAGERFSPEFLRALGRESGKPVHWISANAEAIPAELNGMDIISSIFMFHELPLEARKTILAEAFRALKPGGYFIFIDAIQKGESEAADRVLPTFPKSYHEPFFTDYTQHAMETLVAEAGFQVAKSGVGLLSKFILAKKPPIV